MIKSSSTQWNGRLPLIICLLIGFVLGTSFPTKAIAAEKAIGLACTSDQSAADYDTIAQCSSNVFVRANPMLAQSMAIGTTSLSSGTVVDMSNTNSSMLLPVGTTGQEPTGVSGMLRYNSTISNVEYYNGSAWTPLKVTGGPIGSGYFVQIPITITACMIPATSTLTHSGTTATATLQANHYLTTGASITVSGATPTDYNGTFTITVTGAKTFTYTMATTPASNDTTGTATFFCGSGGLAAANAYCLSELTTNTGWFGYSQANSFSLLNSTHVKAYLCDGSTCNSLNANTTYYFANSQDTSAGGSKFTTDASGLGPNDAADWHSGNYLGAGFGQNPYWSGRSTNTSTKWPNSSATNTCSGWTSVSSSSTGRTGMVQPSQTDGGRWSSADTACNNNFIAMICVVNP